MNLTFPNCPNSPANIQQSAAVLDIALFGTLYFGHPVGCIEFRHPSVTTIVSVPKATMHKDNSLFGGKNQVWLSAEFLTMQAIAISCAKERSSHDELW